MEIDIDIAELAPTMKSDFLEHWTVIIIKPLGHPCPRLGDLTDDLSRLRNRTDLVSKYCAQLVNEAALP